MDDEDRRRKAIEAELLRLEESARYSHQIQFEQSKRWRRVNGWLGVPASVLAAVAGASALATVDGRVIAGLLALLAAALGAILTTVNASRRMNQAASTGNAYLEIETAARQMRLLDLPHEPLDEMRAKLGEITARKDEQNKTAELPSDRAYRRGKRNILAGQQVYEVDTMTQPEKG